VGDVPIVRPHERAAALGEDVLGHEAVAHEDATPGAVPALALDDHLLPFLEVEAEEAHLLGRGLVVLPHPAEERDNLSRLEEEVAAAHQRFEIAAAAL
jgi:hypothetical protein